MCRIIAGALYGLCFMNKLQDFIGALWIGANFLKEGA